MHTDVSDVYHCVTRPLGRLIFNQWGILVQLVNSVLASVVIEIG